MERATVATATAGPTRVMGPRSEMVKHHCHLTRDVTAEEPLQSQRPRGAAVAPLFASEPNVQKKLPFYRRAIRIRSTDCGLQGLGQLFEQALKRFEKSIQSFPPREGIGCGLSTRRVDS